MNRRIAAEYIETVFNRGQVDRISEFVDANIKDHDKPPGLSTANEGPKLKIAAFLRFRDGKITGHWLCFDVASIIN